MENGSKKRLIFCEVEGENLNKSRVSVTMTRIDCKMGQIISCLAGKKNV